MGGESADEQTTLLYLQGWRAQEALGKQEMHYNAALVKSSQRSERNSPSTRSAPHLSLLTFSISPFLLIHFTSHSPLHLWEDAASAVSPSEAAESQVFIDTPKDAKNEILRPTDSRNYYP
jgi:hypothetical protein